MMPNDRSVAASEAGLRTVRLPVRRPDEHTFAPYGRLIGAPLGKPFAIRSTQTVWRFPFVADEATLVQVIRFRRLPLVGSMIERHLHVSETRAPLGAPPMIIVCAPPGDVPAIEDLVAFLLEDVGVMFHPGTWHGVDSYPIGRDADFLFLTDVATGGEVLAGEGLTRTRVHDFREEGAMFVLEPPAELADGQP